MRILSFLILAVTGLAMAVPGLYLATLGGSLYYAIAGVLILTSAWLILRRRAFGVVLFWLVFAATIPWSLWEVGLDGWALMPRLVYLGIARGLEHFGAPELIVLGNRKANDHGIERSAFPVIGLGRIESGIRVVEDGKKEE